MSLRDWFDGLIYVTGFFLALGLCDPAPAASFHGAAYSSGANQMDRYLTEEEQARLLKTLKEAACRDVYGRRDDAMVRALIHSGLRIGEFSRITVGDALEAMKTGYLFVPRENRKGASQGRAKDHSVYLTQALRADIGDLLKVRHELRDMDCRVTDRLLVGRAGDSMTVRALELRYKHHATMAGLSRTSPHWLRHTRAQNIMLRSTARDPRGVVQRALGHASIKSSGVYTATPREAVEEALNEIDTPADRGRVTRAQLRRAYEGRAAA
jgi:site-specific recombinase XerD